MSDEIICIIGGGSSVKQIDLARLPGAIIGVNDSAIHARCNIAVSMDRLWTEYRWPQLRNMRRLAWIRRSALQNLPEKWPWLHSFECDNESTEFSESMGVLNGTNSGLCAFNLAYVMRPKQIYLFGFDMKHSKNGEAYWYKNYPWTSPSGGTSSGKYSVWAKQFTSAAKKCKVAGIDVFNCSIDSAITDFPKIDAREIAREMAS